MNIGIPKRNRVNRRKFLKQGLLLGAVHTFPTTASAMPFEEFAELDALELAALVKRRKVAERDLLETAIARAEAVNPKINAIVGDLADRELVYDLARKAVARGLPDGPLRGVPFLVKDLSFTMKRVPCWMGSKLYQNWIPRSDSLAVKRYRKAGSVLFARTATPELGGIPTTESALTGITRNPWNLDRTAGGSSGGTASAVAAGISPIGSGTDAGGSIRIPASCCGLFGLKPTRERIPLGLEELGNLATLHVLTRSVRDSAVLLDIACGGFRGSPIAPPSNKRPYLKEAQTLPQRLKIGLTTDSAITENVQAECKIAVLDAGKTCQDLGHRVDDITEQYCDLLDWSGLIEAWFTVVTVGAALGIQRRLEELGRDLKKGDLEPGTRSSFEQAKETPATALAAARGTLHQASLQMAKFHRQYDILLSPTLGSPPVEHGLLSLREANDDVQKYMDFNPFCILANATGQPAMSVPLHWSNGGLPIGVQFVARYADEATLFRLAGQLETAKSWKKRRPSL